MGSEFKTNWLIDPDTMDLTASPQQNSEELENDFEAKAKRALDNDNQISDRTNKNKFHTEAVVHTTVAALNSLYNIPSNLGSAAQNQSVFETSNEFYSAKDLKLFQQYYGLTVQPAISIGGHMNDSCSTTGKGNSCFEGNLDVQYIMGIAQVNHFVLSMSVQANVDYTLYVAYFHRVLVCERVRPLRELDNGRV